MAAPKKDGKVWRHRLMIGGVRESGTFATKAAALLWEADLRSRAGNADPATQGAGKTCADAFRK